MTQIVAALTFVAFLMSGLMIALSRSAAKRKLLVQGSLVFLVAVHAAVTVTDRDLWPFTNYRLLDGLAPENEEDWIVAFCGVDANGREWLVDPRAWTPVSDWVMQQWFIRFFSRLELHEKRDVLRFMLERAEAARRRAGSWDESWRPIAAPYWLVSPSAVAPSPSPFSKFRVYEVWFVPAERIGGTVRERRRVLLGEVAR